LDNRSRRDLMSLIIIIFLFAGLGIKLLSKAF
jgi:hypothetical protein